MDYRHKIGDGKLPNKYWVFHYDEKFYINNNEILPLDDGRVGGEVKGELLGEYEKFKDALKCVDEKAYLPHIIIEDRIAGVIYEVLCVVCPCCGNERWETFKDTNFTKEVLEENGICFE